MILTNHEKIILEPEDWSTEEWKVFCKLAQTDPTKCESIQIEAEALKAYEKETKIPHIMMKAHDFNRGMGKTKKPKITAI